MLKKLTAAQQALMDQVDGRWALTRRRRERDGTLMPYLTERKTVDALVRMGLLKWVHAGKDGYQYNGVVRVTPIAEVQWLASAGPVQRPVGREED